jgi:ABC-type nitrate/sulfonate/bicarbonate transport system permease component
LASLPLAAAPAGTEVRPALRAVRWRRPLPDWLSVLGLVLLVLLWQLAHVAVGKYFPTPLAVARAAWANFAASRYFTGLGLPEGGYLPHLVSTTLTVLAGVALGGAVGTATGLASGLDRVARQIFAPLVAILGTVPILVAAPFFLIWFGLAESSKVILVGFYSGVVLHIYAERSLGNLSPRYREYAATLGADLRLTFRAVVLPGVAPELFGGLRTALGAAWGLAAIAELLGALHGIGRVIIATWAVYDVAAMMAGILMLAVIAVVLDGAVVWLRRRLTRWAETKGDA